MMYCFFFQAEDGIRDIGVTGVQTCALPIYYSPLKCDWTIRFSNVSLPLGRLGERLKKTKKTKLFQNSVCMQVDGKN